MSGAGTGSRGSGRARWAALAVGIGAAVILVLASPIGLSTDRSASTCVLGARVDAVWMWTPDVLVNSPDGGGVGFNEGPHNFTISSGAVTVGGLTPSPTGLTVAPDVPQVGTVGVVGASKWIILAVHNETEITSHPATCTQPYVAEMESAMYCLTVGNLSTLLPLENNASDAVEPHDLPANLTWCVLSVPGPTPGASISFDTSFHSGPSGSGYEVSADPRCGPLADTPQNISLDGTAEYPVTINATLPTGQVAHVRGVFAFQGGGGSPTVTYTLSAGWNWTLSNVLPGAAPPNLQAGTTDSLLAFDRTAC